MDEFFFVCVYKAVVSPPMSPVRRGEEASHVTAILESVIHSKQVDRDSIAKLCTHVKADPQEKEVNIIVW